MQGEASGFAHWNGFSNGFYCWRKYNVINPLAIADPAVVSETSHFSTPAL